MSIGSVLEWATCIIDALPQTAQQQVNQIGEKLSQQPYVMAFATIPLVYVLIFLPHTVKLLLMFQRELLNYNNQNPRNTDLKERGYPEWQQQLIQRLIACHLNSFEIFPAYSIGILMCYVAKVNADVVIPIAINFIIARLVYFIFYMLSFSWILSWGRTLSWFLCVKLVLDLFILAVLNVA